jgi:Protein of unknown function (DUF3108)
MKKRTIIFTKSSLLGVGLTVVMLAASVLPTWAVAPLPEVLHYTADMSLIKDVGSATVSLREVGKDKFEGVIEGQTNGLIAAFSAHRRDRYATTMQMVQGKLQPLLYIEESRVGKKHIYKEYRFDYCRRKLELWRRSKNGVMELKWETDLTQPIYDPITALYNFRIGALGEVKAGNTLSVAGIPYPHPETMTIQLGSQEPNNRQATVILRGRPGEDQIGQINARFDDNLVPLSAWTHVALFGRISGRLVGRN